MPYLRLPNTDSARLQALKKAYEKGVNLSPIELAFSQKTFNKLRLFLTDYEKSYIDYLANYKIQVENSSKNYLPKINKAKTYILHFIKVLKMAVERGDLPNNSLDYFGLKQNKTPNLTSEDKIFFWGNKIIEGESKRISLGLKPVTNPTFGVVRVYFDNFVEEYNAQERLKNNTAYLLNILTSKRKEANEILKTVWDEVGEYYNDCEDIERQKKMSEYGVIFISKEEDKKTSTKSLKTNKASKNSIIDYSLPFSFL